MHITITSTSNSIPSYSVDCGDVTIEVAAKAAARIARQWAASINGAYTESSSTYNAATDEYDYSYTIRERDWTCVIPRFIETATVAVQREI